MSKLNTKYIIDGQIEWREEVVFLRRFIREEYDVEMHTFYILDQQTNDGFFGLFNARFNGAQIAKLETNLRGIC